MEVEEKLLTKVGFDYIKKLTGESHVRRIRIHFAVLEILSVDVSEK
jgi:hypothetical protein